MSKILKFNKAIKMKDLIITEGSRTYIIAEAGVNHGGDMNIARRLIDVAKKAGADAVKFQAFKTKNLILQNVAKAPYQTKTTNSRETQFQMLKKLEITKKEIRMLKNYCHNLGITFLITPFDEESLDELDDLRLVAYKISSTDITNLPFLRKVAKKTKPIILSTGMANFSEVRMALEEIRLFNSDIVLLQCSSNYPIKNDEANLNVINTFKENFDILVGYSDHTVGVGAAPYAVAMGARVIEKHFTLDKNLRGPDHKVSLSPDKLTRMINEIRKVEKFLGSFKKEPTLSEKNSKKALQKCLVTKKYIKKGRVFSNKNIIAKRTGGFGLSPLLFHEIIGKVATKNYKRDEIIKL